MSPTILPHNSEAPSATELRRHYLEAFRANSVTCYEDYPLAYLATARAGPVGSSASNTTGTSPNAKRCTRSAFSPAGGIYNCRTRTAPPRMGTDHLADERGGLSRRSNQ